MQALRIVAIVALVVALILAIIV
uniref:Truncated vpu protein n=1 Tax=Human immunodeficiency virus type 1 TaxID=11676 RepID=B5AD28_HV1|nr:truncated vpu protein [Human immunodeficiency virus 1]